MTSIARRHGIAPNQLFAWRRELKRRDVALPFAPLQPPSSRRLLIRMARVDVAPASRWRRKRRRLKGGAVELEIDGLAVTIGRGADAEVIGAVINPPCSSFLAIRQRPTRPRSEGGSMRLTAAQLGALLEDLDWQRVNGGRRPQAPQPASV